MYTRVVRFRGFHLTATTVRRTRDGKVSHLFNYFIDGAVSGYDLAYCNKSGSVFEGLSTYKGKWTDSPDLKLCNNCMRRWRSIRKRWIADRRRNEIFSGTP